MRICGRNTSTPPTPASTPSTNSARIHAGAEARNAETPSERRPTPCSTRSESAVPGQPKVRANISASTAKKMGKANTRWVSTRSILSEMVVSCSRWRGKPDSFNAFSMAA